MKKASQSQTETPAPGGNEALRRGLTYGLLLAVYVGAALLLHFLVGATLEADAPWLLVLVVLAVVLTFDPVHARIQAAVDGALAGEQAAHGELLRRYRRRLMAAVDVDDVAAALLEHAEAGVSGTTADLYLPDGRWSRYTSYGNGEKPPLTDESPLVRLLREEPDVLCLEEEAAWPAELQPHDDAIQALDAAVVVPITGSDGLLGWLTLGRKEEGRRFGRSGLAYLDALAQESAPALERVNVIRRLEARVAELNMLSRYAQALNYTIEFDVLLELISANCQRLLEVDDFYIALRDPETEQVYVAYCLRENERRPEREGRQRRVDDERVLQVMETGQMVVEGDAHDRAWIGAPLNAGAETLGVLYAEAGHPGRAFGERQQQLFGVFADRTATALDRWLANEELQTRARQLETINEITRSLTATVDLQALLELILEKAMALLDTEAGSFLIMDEDTGELEFRVVHGPAGQDLVGTRLPLGAGLAGTAAQSGRPLLVNDVQQDRRWFEGVDATTEFVTRASLSVPLLRQQQVIGVLQVVNKRSGAPFDEDDQALLANFAGQAVVAMETARLLQQTDAELQARVNELSLLQQLDRDLSTTLDLEQVVSITLDWALRLCQGTAGALVLTNDEGRPRIHAARGYDDTFDPEAAPADTLEAGLVGEVLRNGRPHVTGDVHEHENYVTAAFDTRSQLTVPLTFRQETIGAIAIEKDVHDAFGDEDVERAVRLANHAGAAIANALLHRQVIAANEAKSEFVSMVSHELKTPLTAIRGYADLMLGGMTGDVNEQQRKFLQTIGRNIQKTNRLIQDLTDVSRIETGKLNVEPAPISFATVVSESVQTVRGMYDEKEMALHVDLPADLPPVMGDHHRLVQVLTNLLSNACKYSPAGADVYVSVCDEVADEVRRPPQAVIYCAVRDTGYGISEADQARLFTKFFRSANPDVQAAPGTGLGLSITRGIVELHGGEIWFESALDEGTTFHFTVPQAA